MLLVAGQGRANPHPTSFRISVSLASSATHHTGTTSARAPTGPSHGRQLDTLLEVLRLGWPGVRDSSDIMPWGIHEFAKNGIRNEIFHALELNGLRYGAHAIRRRLQALANGG